MLPLCEDYVKAILFRAIAAAASIHVHLIKKILLFIFYFSLFKILFFYFIIKLNKTIHVFVSARTRNMYNSLTFIVVHTLQKYLILN